ncbi:hypothetical protein PM082_012465 [Marasmius tenuissimus]|nr:hypothetical protein PM082_012465 [Marasmius tenuissimus]
MNATVRNVNTTGAPAGAAPTLTAASRQHIAGYSRYTRSGYRNRVCKTTRLKLEKQNRTELSQRTRSPKQSLQKAWKTHTVCLLSTYPERIHSQRPPSRNPPHPETLPQVTVVQCIAVTNNHGQDNTEAAASVFFLQGDPRNADGRVPGSMTQDCTTASVVAILVAMKTAPVGTPLVIYSNDTTTTYKLLNQIERLEDSDFYGVKSPEVWRAALYTLKAREPMRTYIVASKIDQPLHPDAMALAQSALQGSPIMTNTLAQEEPIPEDWPTNLATEVLVGIDSIGHTQDTDRITSQGKDPVTSSNNLSCSESESHTVSNRSYFKNISSGGNLPPPICRMTMSMVHA